MPVTRTDSRRGPALFGGRSGRRVAWDRKVRPRWHLRVPSPRVSGSCARRPMREPDTCPSHSPQACAPKSTQPFAPTLFGLPDVASGRTQHGWVVPRSAGRTANCPVQQLGPGDHGLCVNDPGALVDHRLSTNAAGPADEEQAAALAQLVERRHASARVVPDPYACGVRQRGVPSDGHVVGQWVWYMNGELAAEPVERLGHG